MFSSLITPCEVKLHLLANTVFLHPPAASTQPDEAAPPTTNDEVVRGLVELYVPHARHISGIRVKLRGMQSISILPEARDLSNAHILPMPIAWEDNVFMEKVVDIGLGDGRGRSTTRSRRGSPPNVSRTSSPSRVEAATTPGEGTSTSHGMGAIGAAFARAVSRGRPSSRPNSQPPSRPSSRPTSRAVSPARSSTLDSEPVNGGLATPLPASPHVTPLHVPSRQNSTTTLLTPPPESSPAYEPDEHEAMGSSHEEATLLHAVRQLDLAGHAPERTPNETWTVRRGRGTLTGPPPSASPHTLSPQREERGVGATGARSSSVGWPFGRGARSASRGAASRNARSGTPGPPAARRTPSVDVVGTVLEDDDGQHGEGIELAKGVHGFEFAFILPADSPPYERSPFGRVRYVIKATAFGAGRAKSNVEAWRDLFPVVNPSPDGGATALTMLYNDIHPTLGLVSIACTSNNISVGGVFNVDIHSPTPPQDLIVYLVRVSLETTIELKTKRKGKQVVPVHKIKVWEKGYVPPRPKDPHGPGDGKKSEGSVRDPSKPGASAEDTWSVQGVARMPSDNHTRASTVPGSKSSIRFSHQLLVEIIHSRQPDKPDGERKLKVFALRQPVLIPSCCAAFEAVTLPVYTAEDSSTRSAAMPYDIGIGHGGPPTPNGISGGGEGGAVSTSASSWVNTAQAQHGPQHDFCVCGQSMQDLTERERAMIPVQAGYDVPLDAMRAHGKIGELPPAQSGAGLALVRSSSRSSSRSARSPSVTRRSLSRSLSTARQGSASGFGRAPSVTRSNVDARGEGAIRSMSRGARAQELPGEATGHHSLAPPSYGAAIEEEDGPRGRRGR